MTCTSSALLDVITEPTWPSNCENCVLDNIQLNVLYYLILKVSVTVCLAAAAAGRPSTEGGRQWSEAAPDNHHCPLLGSTCLHFNLLSVHSTLFNTFPQFQSRQESKKRRHTNEGEENDLV